MHHKCVFFPCAFSLCEFQFTVCGGGPSVGGLNFCMSCRKTVIFSKSEEKKIFVGGYWGVIFSWSGGGQIVLWGVPNCWDGEIRTNCKIFCLIF